MPLLLLPLISSVEPRSTLFSVWQDDDQWTCYLGEYPIYSNR